MRQSARRPLHRTDVDSYALGVALLDDLCERPLIEKDRYKIPYGTHTWEVDEFFGDNAGLIMAEVELESEDQAFEMPEWIGREVSDDPRYFNANLIANPYRNWGGKE